MKTLQTVRLELLRHGPAHNQLLSPLTTYTGISGDSEIAAITIELEHQKLEALLKLLAYRRPGDRDGKIGNIERRQALEEMAAIVTRVLEKNPGLASQISSAGEQGTLRELRLVMSATELALLPFELSRVPVGWSKGASAHWLGLQLHYPVCITRSNRLLRNLPFQWQKKPRILFLSAGVEPFLVEMHLQALMLALAPWLPLNEASDVKALHEHIRIVPDASLDVITEICSESTFTHVHILAHGKADSERIGAPVGLLLYSPDNEHGEVVSAGQLTMALTGRQGSCAGKVAELPLVVTLASCGSGFSGNPVHSHGSFAHLLHTAGVPVVIGSQFPLSFRGSVLMTNHFYSGLLQGEDPRSSLHNTRRILHARCSSDRHDWASLVGYMALPENFSEQLVDFQYQQAKDALDNSLAALDDAGMDKADDLIKYVDRAMQWMPDNPAYATEVVALKGAVAKRKAEMYFRQATGSGKNDEKLLQESKRQLTRAIGYYRQAARQSVAEGEGIIRKKRALHWSLTQYLVLMAVAHGRFREKEWQQWHAAMFSARVDMKNREGTEIWSWAAASAMELHLLRYVLTEVCLDKGEKSDTIPDKEKQESLHWAYKLACKLHRNCEDPGILSLTRKQLKRYGSWLQKIKYFCLIDGNTDDDVRRIRSCLADIAADLCDILTSDHSSCPGSRP